MFSDIFRLIINGPWIRPHVLTKDIRYLKFNKMRDMGMEKIIFDKDNTLTTYFNTLFKSKGI